MTQEQKQLAVSCVIKSLLGGGTITEAELSNLALAVGGIAKAEAVEAFSAQATPLAANLLARVLLASDYLQAL
jgi:hypothetical protein